MFALAPSMTDNLNLRKGEPAMTMIKQIEPQEWDTFLNAFTERNRERRARFEIFSRGDFSEEEQEGYFESVSIDGNTVTVNRSYEKHGEQATMTDELGNIRGISVQYDTDNSENVLEFTNDKNELTTLHFESRVDGDS
jgi:hypothetical protein